jgi:hypothetical protein
MSTLNPIASPVRPAPVAAPEVVETAASIAPQPESTFDAGSATAPAAQATPEVRDSLSQAKTVAQVKGALERLAGVFGPGYTVQVDGSNVSLVDGDGKLAYGFDIRGNSATVTGPKGREAGTIVLGSRPSDLVGVIIAAGRKAEAMEDYVLGVGSDWQTGQPQIYVSYNGHDSADYVFTQLQDGQIHLEFQTNGPGDDLGTFPLGSSPMTAAEASLEIGSKVGLLPGYVMSAGSKNGEPVFILSSMAHPPKPTYEFDVAGERRLAAMKLVDGVVTPIGRIGSDANSVEKFFRSGKVPEVDRSYEKETVAATKASLQRRADELNREFPNEGWRVIESVDPVGRPRLTLADSMFAKDSHTFTIHGGMAKISQSYDNGISGREVGDLYLGGDRAAQALASYFAADRIGRDLSGDYLLEADMGARGGNSVMLNDISGHHHSVNYDFTSQFGTASISVFASGATEPHDIASLVYGKFPRTELEIAFGASLLGGTTLKVKEGGNSPIFEIQAKGITYRFQAVAGGTVEVKRIAANGTTTVMPRITLGETPVKAFTHYGKTHGLI